MTLIFLSPWAISTYRGLTEPNRHGVVFLCERANLALPATRPLVIDLTGSGEAQPVHLDINPETARSHDGPLAVPHALALVLAELLHPLASDPGLDQAIARGLGLTLQVHDELIPDDLQHPAFRARLRGRDPEQVQQVVEVDFGAFH